MCCQFPCDHRGGGSVITADKLLVFDESSPPPQPYVLEVSNSEREYWQSEVYRLSRKVEEAAELLEDYVASRRTKKKHLRKVLKILKRGK
jgi:hypothetical protein